MRWDVWAMFVMSGLALLLAVYQRRELDLSERRGMAIIGVIGYAYVLAALRGVL